jgi:hypothetical protein
MKTIVTKNGDAAARTGARSGKGGHTGFWLIFMAVAAVGTAGLVQRWQERMALRGEIGVKEIEVEALGRLQAENRRLKARQIPVAELEALRADHAALARLKAELESLKVGPK